MMAQEATLERDDVLLLLLLALSKGGTSKVPSITRIEKLMFLLQEETGFSGKLRDKFDFRAWKFGPFSKEIYEDLDLLSTLELVDVEERDLANYMEFTEQDELIESERGEPIIEKVFTLTDRGKRVAEKLKSLISEKDWSEIESLRRRFETSSLTRLIQYVYYKYPETTEKSVLEHLKPRQRA
jgi:DNA-binding PadR family transcriptional regulator